MTPMETLREWLKPENRPASLREISEAAAVPVTWTRSIAVGRVHQAGANRVAEVLVVLESLAAINKERDERVARLGALSRARRRLAHAANAK